MLSEAKNINQAPLSGAASNLSEKSSNSHHISFSTVKTSICESSGCPYIESAGLHYAVLWTRRGCGAKGRSI